MIELVGRRLPRWLLEALCLALAASQPLAAQAIADDAFALATASFERGDYRQALRHFDAARDAGAQGPALIFNIGVCHYELGEYREAAAAFRELADGYPAMRALAQYNLGLSLLKQRRRAAAQRAFLAAKAGDDDKLRALAERQLARLSAEDSRAAAPRRRWAFADLGGGYDDNVALIETALPVGESSASPFAEAFVVGSVPLGSTAWTGDGSAYLVRYTDASEFDEIAVRAGVSRSWTWRAWRADFAPHYDRSTLGGSAFEQLLGATLDLRRSLGGLQVAVRLGHDEVAGLGDFGFLEGRRERLGARLDTESAENRWRIGYEHEQNERTSASVSPSRDRLRVRYRRRVGRDWEFEAQVSRRRSRYGELQTPRTETLDDLALAGIRRLHGGWRLDLRYGTSDNASSDAVYAYRRSRFVVVFDKAF